MVIRQTLNASCKGIGNPPGPKGTVRENYRASVAAGPLYKVTYNRRRAEMQVRSFTKDRWCFHIGPVEVIWMRRPMCDGTEHLLTFSVRR